MTKRTVPQPGRAALALAMLAVVSGCSSAADRDDATAAPADAAPIATTDHTGATGLSTPVDDRPAVASTEPPPADSAGSSEDATLLAQLYSLLGVGTRAEHVTGLAATNVPQDEIARCMSEAGFQYTEGPTPDEEVDRVAELTMPAEDYAARYGFGVAAWDLGLFPPVDVDMSNINYQSTLTAGQRDAYFQALHQCEGMTPERVARGNAFSFALERFRENVAADDRIAAATAEWSACMAAAGFSFDSPEAMRDAFRSRHNGRLAQDELQRLHTDEVAAATASVPCEAPYRDTYRAVVADRLSEFGTLLDTAISSGAAPEAAG